MNKESRNNTSALPNADSRRGGKTPSSARLTSCTSPEVQSDAAENSQTGVSSDYAQEEKEQWFVLRATYGRTSQALDALRAKNVETYLPMHYVIKEIDGKRKLIHEPLLPNIIFARMTRQKTHDFVKEPASTAKWLKYYTDKTKPVERSTGKNPPVTIPDNEMINFINATSVKNEHSGMMPSERVHYKSGDLVQIIKGDFTGVIGRVARAGGQQRVAIDIEGLGTFVTAYIPNDFMVIYSNDRK